MKATALSLPRSSSRVSRENREEFAKHAGPGAILHQLKNAERRLREAEREVRWLSDLYDERGLQIEAGEWPAPKPGGEVILDASED